VEAVRRFDIPALLPIVTRIIVSAASLHCYSQLWLPVGDMKCSLLFSCKWSRMSAYTKNESEGFFGGGVQNGSVAAFHITQYCRHNFANFSIINVT
jgi:hypothetical protein